MNITVTVEISKEKIENFEELEATVYQAALKVGREVLRESLERMDTALLEERDGSRYRNKGFQKTCIKTVMGAVEYKRRIYVDSAAVETQRCVSLLDEALEIRKVGLVSAGMCRMAAEAVCESSYRGSAALLSKATGLSISHQGVWNIIQELGKSQHAVTERHAELAQLRQGAGALPTKLLYEENDGIWLHLQGKSRKENGPSKEMKVGIAYDGVLWQKTAGGKRRSLDNKVAYAGFCSAREFRRNKEGVIASRFNVDEVELRVINGDGAAWIQRKQGENCICVLDEFHRNKKLTECVKDEEFAQLLRSLLYAGDIQALMSCLEAQINSVTDETEIAGLKTLQQYYKENQSALLGYYDRGITIPETREPGVIHHARLGSMESNVYTLIGNRMKGGRACWSIDGANNLALLLCRKHTTGFEDLFAKPEPLPAKEPEEWETAPILSADKTPEHVGHGYECWANVSLSNSMPWLQNLVKQLNRF